MASDTTVACQGSCLVSTKRFLITGTQRHANIRILAESLYDLGVELCTFRGLHEDASVGIVIFMWPLGSMDTMLAVIYSFLEQSIGRRLWAEAKQYC